MPIMNLLVAFNGSDGSEAALRYAASLSRSQGSYVTAMLAHSSHEVIDRTSRWIPKEARLLLVEANTSLRQRIESKFESLRTELGLGEGLKFRERSGRVDTTLAEAARCFDILIVGSHSDDDDEHVTIHPDRIALLSGRPVIVVPAGYDAGANHSHAVLAWDEGRSSARALSDGLRLLEADGKVSVLSTDHGRRGLMEDLLTHLYRHDIEATEPMYENIPESLSVCDMILDYCEKHDPSLLILGAYEHSKFREDFFGGMTMDVLRNIRIPVLLSH